MSGFFATTLFLPTKNHIPLQRHFKAMRDLWREYLGRTIENGTIVTLRIEVGEIHEDFDLQALFMSRLAGINFPTLFLKEWSDHANVLLEKFRALPEGKEVFVPKRTQFVVVGANITFNL